MTVPSFHFRNTTLESCNKNSVVTTILDWLWSGKGFVVHLQLLEVVYYRGFTEIKPSCVYVPEHEKFTYSIKKRIKQALISPTFSVQDRR